MLTSTFCKNEGFDVAIQIMQEMIERCMARNTCVLSELYSGLCRRENDQLAIKLLNEMEIRCLLLEGFDKARTINSKPHNHDKEIGDSPFKVAEATAVLCGIRFAVDAGLVPAVIESDA
ncbi:hypothetical protein LWI28_016242 [Acer negundo]|uniref:Pentatricopeptide repeat-containing protein n=1 Tax=Acer negundo TaxID=4023 RepID=A0AAD5IV37_ACENE|nr:hypothetical protein LWI28_016242 [Acer negundo]